MQGFSEAADDNDVVARNRRLHAAVHGREAQVRCVLRQAGAADHPATSAVPEQASCRHLAGCATLLFRISTPIVGMLPLPAIPCLLRAPCRRRGMRATTATASKLWWHACGS